MAVHATPRAFRRVAPIDLKTFLCGEYRNCLLGADLLQELDSVSEGIKDVDAVESCEWFVRYRWKPGGAAPGRKLCQAAHQNCRVRFARRMEVPIDAEMKAQIPAAKPDATTGRKIRRFRFLN
jgi:hypothetical protein